VHHDSQDKQRGLFGLNADALAARIEALASDAVPLSS
jgi:hypothetical protein